jgi:hypothetical protein
MWAKRSQTNLAKINTGDPGALAKVVRDLQSTGEGSGSSFSQRKLFELALDRLAAEFAAVHRTAKPDAIEQLTQALLEARAGSQGGRQRGLYGCLIHELCWQSSCGALCLWNGAFRARGLPSP